MTEDAGVLMTSAGNTSSLLHLFLCSYFSLCSSPRVLEQILDMKGKKGSALLLLTLEC